MLKCYHGKQKRIDDGPDAVEIEKRFYDEREWRYIPAGAKLTMFNSKAEADDFAFKMNKSEEYRHSLDFALQKKFLEYIIVPNMKEFMKMIDKKSKPGVRLGLTEKEAWSKVLTVTQIKRDF